MVRGAIPQELLPAAEQARLRLLEELALADERLFEQYTADAAAITAEMIHDALRQASIDQKLVPVFCAAAYRNKGMQPLLDAVVQYLPAPEDVPFNGPTLEAGAGNPFAGLVFKIVTNDYTGKLCLIRVYTGTLHAGDSLWNSRTGRKVRVNRLLRVMSNKYEAVARLEAGDIGALLGLKETRTGDTLSDPDHPVVLEAMSFPAPVIGYAIEARSAKESSRLGESLSRLLEEDPTLSVEVDADSGQTILKGMGELHLDVVLEKLRSDYQVEVNKGQPQIAYRETFTRSVTHTATYRKQNGGSGNFAEIKFELSPRADGQSGLEFIDAVRGGAIPREFIASVEKGFEKAMSTGPLAGYPVESMCIRLFDGSIHEKDSHAPDFEQVAQIGFKAARRTGRTGAAGARDECGGYASGRIYRNGNRLSYQAKGDHKCNSEEGCRAGCPGGCSFSRIVRVYHGPSDAHRRKGLPERGAFRLKAVMRIEIDMNKGMN